MDKVLSVFVDRASYGLVLFPGRDRSFPDHGPDAHRDMAHGALYMFGGYVGLWVANTATSGWEHWRARWHPP